MKMKLLLAAALLSTAASAQQQTNGNLIINGTLPLTKIVPQAAGTTICKPAGSGSGSPIACDASQAGAALGLAPVATTGSASDLSTGTLPTARLPAFTGGDTTSSAGSTALTTNSVGGVSAANVASGANLANAATNANTASAIVKRDASGNFSAGTITGNLTGTASFATTAGTANSATQADYATNAGQASTAETLSGFVPSNTFIGNNSVSPAAPTAITASQAKTVLAITAGDVSGLAPSATTDTTNATNITSGTLSLSRLPAQANNTVLGNTSGSAAVPVAIPLWYQNATAGYVPPTVGTGFFLDSVGGVNVWAVQNRMLVGGAVSSNIGNFNGLGFSMLPAALSNSASYLIRDAQLGVVSTNGLWSIGAMVDCADGARASCGAAGFFALINSPSARGGRALYLETQIEPSSGVGVANEIVIKDKGGVSGVPTPYGGTQTSGGETIGCGGDPAYGGTATTNCSFATLIQLGVTTGFRFNKGIVFRSDSLAGSDGTSSGGNAGQAMEMGYGQGIRWISSNGTPQAGRISSVGTSSADQSHDMQFANNKVQFANNNSGFTVDMTHVASGQNGLRFTDAVNGSGPILTAQAAGGDTSIDLNITPVGSGVIRLNGATTSTGLFTTPQENISGNVSAAAWTTAGIGFKTTASTYTDTTSSGVVASNYVHNIAAPTLAASSATTYTNAYTLDIANCPTAGSNVTISTCGALRVGGGNAQFNGLITGGLGATIGGATINLNASSTTNVTNIGTGSTTGAVTIGGASNTVILGSVTTLKAYTVGTLPTCAAGITGGMAYVTDATAPTYNGALTGGGAVKVPVFCDGAAWSSH